MSFGPEWGSWASPEEFVDKVLVRLPSPRVMLADERDALAAELEAGTTPNRLIVTRLAQEPQVDATVGETTRQYAAFFGRRPETGGLRYWSEHLATGLPADQVARHFAASAETRETYAGLSPGQIVDRLYGTALGRAAEASGRQYWVHALEDGLPLWKLVWHVARSTEMRARWADRVLGTVLHFAWKDLGPNTIAWEMGGEMYAWAGLRFGMTAPGLP